MATETAVLELADVRVTTTKVVIGGTTYFLPNITSVKLREDNNTQILGVLVAIGGAVCLAAGIYKVVVALIVCGLVGAAVGVVMYIYGVSYDLILTTGAAEQQALRSSDKAMLTRVLAAINVAVEQRHS